MGPVECYHQRPPLTLRPVALSLPGHPSVQAGVSSSANCFAAKDDQRDDAAALAPGQGEMRSHPHAPSAGLSPTLPHESGVALGKDRSESAICRLDN